MDHLRFCRRLAALGRLTPECLSAVFQTGLEPGYDTGRLSSGNFTGPVRTASVWTCLTPGSGKSGPKSSPPWRMEEVAAHLARRYPLYLLSNTNPLHFQYIQDD